jgi:hypothetical protein
MDKLRPCDCKSIEETKQLPEAGIKFNDKGILVEPLSVVITVGECILRVPMSTFRIWAEWYLGIEP